MVEFGLVTERLQVRFQVRALLHSSLGQIEYTVVYTPLASSRI